MYSCSGGTKHEVRDLSAPARGRHYLGYPKSNPQSLISGMQLLTTGCGDLYHTLTRFNLRLTPFSKLRHGVLGVAKMSMSMSVNASVCVCVRVSVFSCGIRVVFAYIYYTYLILFFALLYSRNLLPGHVIKPFLASVT